MKFKNIAAAIALTLLATSCSSPKNIAYMQNAVYGQEEAVLNLNEIRIQPKDQVSIVVSCKEPELARLFNLVQASSRVGQEGAPQANGNVSVYTVDNAGDIECVYPMTGLHN